MSNIFYNVEPKIINTELACLIGLNEAIVLQQLHYWIEKNKAIGANFNDGHTWTYGTIQEYRGRDFRFWSFNTVKRTLARLTDLGFLIKGNYNKKKMDNTSWYAIDYTALDVWISQNAKKNDSTAPPAQNELAEQPKMSRSDSPIWAGGTAQHEPSEQPILPRPIPEIKKEINSKRLDKKTHTQKAPSPTAAGVCVRKSCAEENADVFAGQYAESHTEPFVEPPIKPYADPHAPAHAGVIVDPAELLFDKFWELYPRKESRRQAKKAWMKLNPGQELFDLIANALEYRSQTKEWLAEGGRYIPHPAKWLYERRWEDEQDTRKFCKTARFQAQYGDVLIDGKPIDPLQRKQIEYIEKRLRERGVTNNGGTL